jgi:hypothetical protein
VRLRPARRAGHRRLRAALPPSGPQFGIIAEFSRARLPFAVAVPRGQLGLTETMQLLTLNDDGRPAQIARIEHSRPAEPKIVLAERIAALGPRGLEFEQSGAQAAVLALWRALVDGVAVDPELQLRIAPHPLIRARFAAHGWTCDFREPRWFRT